MPPERIVILNEKRDEILGSRVGLLPDDTQVKLICRTEGGESLLALFLPFKLLDSSDLCV